MPIITRVTIRCGRRTLLGEHVTDSGSGCCRHQHFTEWPTSTSWQWVGRPECETLHEEIIGRAQPAAGGDRVRLIHRGRLGFAFAALCAGISRLRCFDSVSSATIGSTGRNSRALGPRAPRSSPPRQPWRSQPMAVTARQVLPARHLGDRAAPLRTSIENAFFHRLCRSSALRPNSHHRAAELAESVVGQRTNRPGHSSVRTRADIYSHAAVAFISQGQPSDSLVGSSLPPRPPDDTGVAEQLEKISPPPR